MSPDVAASVKARLLNGARARHEEFERTLSRFAIERVLYRLGKSAARGRCVIKGAALLGVWVSKPYRPTRDIDVLTFGASDDAAIRAVLEEICAIQCPEDGLRFDLGGLVIEPIRVQEEYAGKRARFPAYLGKAEIRVQIDFGFGDSPGNIEEIDYPTLLANLPAPRLRAYPPSASIAEKFDAMVKLDVKNSRMKDFHDIWALSGELAFDGPTLRNSIAACFDRRRTPLTAEVPRALALAFYSEPQLKAGWSGYLKGSGLLVPPPAQFEVIGERLIQFLRPVHESIAFQARFDARWWRTTRATTRRRRNTCSSPSSSCTPTPSARK
jgi:hypothetical protein